jgi:hypothetical protein
MPDESTPETRCCFICHRYRPVAKMDGNRCIDRDACLKASFRAAPVSVSKRILRKQFGNVIE